MIEPVSSPQLLHDVETCSRKGYFARNWSPNKLPPVRIVSESIRSVILAPTPLETTAWGELAGDAVMQIVEDRGIENDGSNQYPEAIHNACLADLIVTVLRKPADSPWLVPPNVQGWTSGAYLSPDGEFLRRIALVSHWTDERHYAECRNWFTLGEIAHYELPMQLIVVVLGQSRHGKRHGPWSMGYLHPSGNHVLRFRRRKRGFRDEGHSFDEKWEKIFREDHAEITREKWLQAMLTDDVMDDSLFRVDIPVPPLPHLQRIREMAARKLDFLYALRQKPERNLSTCDWPAPCQFRRLCHGIPEKEPSEKTGFLRVSQIASRSSSFQGDSRRSSETLPCPG